MNERKTPTSDATISDLDTARVRQVWEQRKTQQPGLANLESRITAGRTIVVKGEVLEDPVAFFVIQGSLVEIISEEHAGQEFREVVNEVGPGGLAFCQGVTGHANNPSLISVAASGSGAVVARFRREHIEQFGISMTVVQSLFEGMRRTLTLLARATIDRFEEAAEFERQVLFATEQTDAAFEHMQDAERRAEEEARNAQEAQAQAAVARTALIRAREGFDEELRHFQLTNVGFEVMVALCARLIVERGTTAEQLPGLLTEMVGDKPAILGPVQEAIAAQLPNPESLETPEDAANAWLDDRATGLPNTIHVDVEYTDRRRLEEAHDTQVGLAPPEPVTEDVTELDTIPAPAMDETNCGATNEPASEDRPALNPGDIETLPPMAEPEELSSEPTTHRQTDIGGLTPSARHTEVGVAPPSVNGPARPMPVIVRRH